MHKFCLYFLYQDPQPHYSAGSRARPVNGYDQEFDTIPTNEEAKNGGKKGLDIFCCENDNILFFSK